MRRYYVYIMASVTRTLYTGMTNSLSLRVAQHKEKAVPSFTERYNVTRLVHYEMYERVHDAIRREKQIKGWARAKKIALIEQDNPNWEELDPR